MAVADLNLSGCAHWTERMQHSLLFLERFLLHTPDLAALLAPSTGLAACTPLTWQPTFRENQNYFLESQGLIILLKQLLGRTYPPRESFRSIL